MSLRIADSSRLPKSSALVMSQHEFKYGRHARAVTCFVSSAILVCCVGVHSVCGVQYSGVSGFMFSILASEFSPRAKLTAVQSSRSVP
jgi:hypothetical protein